MVLGFGCVVRKRDHGCFMLIYTLLLRILGSTAVTINKDSSASYVAQRETISIEDGAVAFKSLMLLSGWSGTRMSSHLAAAIQHCLCQ